MMYKRFRIVYDYDRLNISRDFHTRFSRTLCEVFAASTNPSERITFHLVNVDIRTHKRKYRFESNGTDLFRADKLCQKKRDFAIDIRSKICLSLVNFRQNLNEMCEISLYSSIVILYRISFLLYIVVSLKFFKWRNSMLKDSRSFIE